MASSSIVTAAIAAVALPILYIYRLNQLWKCIPQEALEISPHRWTEDEIKKTYEKVCKKPIDFRKILPPKLERRYIVVGGAGTYWAAQRLTRTKECPQREHGLQRNADTKLQALWEVTLSCTSCCADSRPRRSASWT